MHINNLLSLKNSSAIVIGGAGKIGYPISEALAEAGAKVYICSTNPYINIRHQVTLFLCTFGYFYHNQRYLT